MGWIVFIFDLMQYHLFIFAHLPYHCNPNPQNITEVNALVCFAYVFFYIFIYFMIPSQSPYVEILAP